MFSSLFLRFVQYLKIYGFKVQYISGLDDLISLEDFYATYEDKG